MKAMLQNNMSERWDMLKTTSNILFVLKKESKKRKALLNYNVAELIMQ